MTGYPAMSNLTAGTPRSAAGFDRFPASGLPAVKVHLKDSRRVADKAVPAKDLFGGAPILFNRVISQPDKDPRL
jgi:hypothetical protein